MEEKEGIKYENLHKLDYNKIHIIVTHLAPDFDALVSTYILKKAFPSAKVRFTEMGSKIETEDKKGGILFHTDTGGVHHDHHHYACYCKECMEKTGELYLVPADVDWNKKTCPNCGKHFKKDKIEAPVSSTHLTAADKQVLARLPDSIKNSPAFKPLINAVNLWDNGQFDQIGENDKNLLSCELKGYTHVFKLLEGFNIEGGEDEAGSQARMDYATKTLDRLFKEGRPDLLISITAEDKIWVKKYDSYFKTWLDSVKKGGLTFSVIGGKTGIIYEKMDMRKKQNPKIVYQYFDIFGYMKDQSGNTGCSASPKSGVEFTAFFEVLRKQIADKKCYGNYPGKEGDGEVIIVAGGTIVLFDPVSLSKAEAQKENEQRISVNAKLYKENFVDNQGFIRLFYQTFADSKKSYDDAWKKYIEEKE